MKLLKHLKNKLLSVALPKIFLIVSVIFGVCTMHVPAASAQTTAQPKQITVAANIGYPPFSILLPNGELTGLLPEMWRLWGKTTGTKVNFTTGSLVALIASMKVLVWDYR